MSKIKSELKHGVWLLIYMLSFGVIGYYLYEFLTPDKPWWKVW